MLNDPELAKKVDAAVSARAGNNAGSQGTDGETSGDGVVVMTGSRGRNGRRNGNELVETAGSNDNPMLAQVVGIIIGSPEYQRR